MKNATLCGRLLDERKILNSGAFNFAGELEQFCHVQKVKEGHSKVKCQKDWHCSGIHALSECHLGCLFCLQSASSTWIIVDVLWSRI